MTPQVPTETSERYGEIESFLATYESELNPSSKVAMQLMDLLDALHNDVASSVDQCRHVEYGLRLSACVLRSPHMSHDTFHRYVEPWIERARGLWGRAHDVDRIRLASSFIRVVAVASDNKLPALNDKSLANEAIAIAEQSPWHSAPSSCCAQVALLLANWTVVLRSSMRDPSNVEGRATLAQRVIAIADIVWGDDLRAASYRAAATAAANACSAYQFLLYLELISGEEAIQTVRLWVNRICLPEFISVHPDAVIVAVVEACRIISETHRASGENGLPRLAEVQVWIEHIHEVARPEVISFAVGATSGILVSDTLTPEAREVWYAQLVRWAEWLLQSGKKLHAMGMAWLLSTLSNMASEMATESSNCIRVERLLEESLDWALKCREMSDLKSTPWSAMATYRALLARNITQVVEVKGDRFAMAVVDDWLKWIESHQRERPCWTAASWFSVFPNISSPLGEQITDERYGDARSFMLLAWQHRTEDSVGFSMALIEYAGYLRKANAGKRSYERTEQQPLEEGLAWSIRAINDTTLDGVCRLCAYALAAGFTAELARRCSAGIVQNDEVRYQSKRCISWLNDLAGIAAQQIHVLRPGKRLEHDAIKEQVCASAATITMVLISAGHVTDVREATDAAMAAASALRCEVDCVRAVAKAIADSMTAAIELSHERLYLLSEWLESAGKSIGVGLHGTNSAQASASGASPETLVLVSTALALALARITRQQHSDQRALELYFQFLEALEIGYRVLQPSQFSESWSSTIHEAFAEAIELAWRLHDSSRMSNLRIAELVLRVQSISDLLMRIRIQNARRKELEQEPQARYAEVICSLHEKGSCVVALYDTGTTLLRVTSSDGGPVVDALTRDKTLTAISRLTDAMNKVALASPELELEAGLEKIGELLLPRSVRERAKSKNTDHLIVLPSEFSDELAASAYYCASYVEVAPSIGVYGALSQTFETLRADNITILIVCTEDIAPYFGDIPEVVQELFKRASIIRWESGECFGTECGTVEPDVIVWLVHGRFASEAPGRRHSAPFYVLGAPGADEMRIYPTKIYKHGSIRLPLHGAGKPKRGPGALNLTVSLKKTRIVLSGACSSGRSGRVMPQVAEGLVRAFLSAGVPTVVAPVWDVIFPNEDYRVVIDMWTELLSSIRAGRTPCDAVHRAREVGRQVAGSARGIEEWGYWTVFGCGQNPIFAA